MVLGAGVGCRTPGQVLAFSKLPVSEGERSTQSTLELVFSELGSCVVSELRGRKFGREAGLTRSGR